MHTYPARLFSQGEKMKHLIWGIIATIIGSFFLLGMLLLAHPTLGMGIYGGIFLAYGIYRINQYRISRKGANLETNKDSLQK
jgi:hypothetical protein